jgi:hypothetical protein
VLIAVLFGGFKMAAAAMWVIMMSLTQVSCALHSTDVRPPSAATSLLFFYVVNERGQPAAVTVLADGKELFTRSVEPSTRPSVEPSPPRSGSGAVEIKVPLPDAANLLEVRVMPSGKEKDFAIGGFRRSSAGFRIVITPDDISVFQDYYPVR